MLDNESTNGDGFSVYRKIRSGPAVAVHGQVFTRPHIVDLILDLAGYTCDKALAGKTLLEPGSGGGAFLLTAAKRLLSSKPAALTYKALSPCLLGVEKDEALVEQTRAALTELLVARGARDSVARDLAKAWAVCADFLEVRTDRRFEFVVGNPPYVRQEAIPKGLLEGYRSRFSCFYDRADLYVAFFEQALDLLSESGTLAFICPNRFTKNNYGRKLRQKITHSFRLTHVVDMPQASPFEPEVLCYPGIYVVQRGTTQAVEHVLMTHAVPEECEQARAVLLSQETGIYGDVAYHRYESWFPDESKWATHSPEHLALLRKLEAEGLPLSSEGSGCKVGIGVATGADDLFIVREGQTEVERELLLPLVTTRDITSGQVRWRGQYLINPFRRDGSGGLIELEGYPGAKKYFESHRARLANRNVGKRNPIGWYRTIDRVYPELVDRPMVLIPDIKGSNGTIALKEGSLYPHHNLYYVTSSIWDMKTLRGILRSDLARFFVFMYGVRMRQGYYRFQAQYLRRICLPSRIFVDNGLIAEIAEASERDDFDKLNALVAKMYGLSRREALLLRSFDEFSKTRGLEESG